MANPAISCHVPKVHGHTELLTSYPLRCTSYPSWTGRLWPISRMLPSSSILLEAQTAARRVFTRKRGAALNPFAVSRPIWAVRAPERSVEVRWVKYRTSFKSETGFEKPLTSPIQRATRHYMNRLMRNYFLSPRLILPGFVLIKAVKSSPQKAVYPL